jgi:hypothetical protein
LFGIWIRSRLDPDFLGHIRILERAMAVRGAIFHTRRQIELEIPDFTSTVWIILKKRKIERYYNRAENIIEFSLNPPS